jgi:5-hydroxyisourate hydrolase
VTQVSTHVLDIARGAPAAGVDVELLAAAADGGWLSLGRGQTDTDGRAAGLAGPGGAEPGLHRLVFAVGAHQGQRTEAAFIEEASVSFRIAGETRLHVPLLLSPYGISIYRGS